MAPVRLAIVLCVAAACGKSGESAHQPPPKDDAAIVKAAPARIDLPAQPLGLPSLVDYQWRKRAGQTAFKVARKAESHGDWPAVEAACTEALRADPGHLDAAWLLAAALGEQGKVAAVEAPLSLAVAGDFGKWGGAALELPQLRAFLATPIGLGWTRRAEEDRVRYLEALARATIVAGDGELYAFDPKLARWHRLTRTGGAVVGTLAPAGERVLAYVTRQGPKGKREPSIAYLTMYVALLCLGAGAWSVDGWRARRSSGAR